ncbi:MAG: hypothetical protein RL329_3565 [Bacteroidota bacterium]|jgi:hypothetical protein
MKLFGKPLQETENALVSHALIFYFLRVVVTNVVFSIVAPLINNYSRTDIFRILHYDFFLGYLVDTVKKRYLVGKKGFYCLKSPFLSYMKFLIRNLTQR